MEKIKIINEEKARKTASKYQQETLAIVDKINEIVEWIEKHEYKPQSK